MIWYLPRCFVYGGLLGASQLVRSEHFEAKAWCYSAVMKSMKTKRALHRASVVRPCRYILLLVNKKNIVLILVLGSRRYWDVDVVFIGKLMARVVMLSVIFQTDWVLAHVKYKGAEDCCVGSFSVHKRRIVEYGYEYVSICHCRRYTVYWYKKEAMNTLWARSRDRSNKKQLIECYLVLKAARLFAPREKMV